MGIRSLSVLFVAVLVSLSACGNKADDNGVATAGNGTATAAPSASASLDARDAQLRYAQCMRENGVNVADPDPGQPVRITGNGMDMTKLEAAQRKCQSILQAGGVNPTQNDAQAQDAMVKFAQCMREHGINVPDPKPGEGLKLQNPGGSEAQAQAAQQACQQFLPGAAQGGASK
jgi:formate-dependent nitrite reductase cytochrome c552 subunit